MKPAIAHNRPSQGGFTLVEVMIASGLLSFEILAVIAMFAVAAKSTSYSRRLTTATSIAQNLLEEAKNTDYDNLPLLETVNESTDAVCFDREMKTVACGTAAAIFGRIVHIAQDVPVPGMAEVSVEVRWIDDSHNTHQTHLVTGVSKF